VTDEVNHNAVDLGEKLAVEGAGRWPAFAFGAFLAGAGIGGGFTYLFTKRRLETKYQKIADDEIAQMRQHYQAKIKAAEAQAQKLAPVKDIVSDRGYAEPSSDGPPMAVQPPKTVAEVEDEGPGEPPDDPEPEREYFEGHGGKKIPKLTPEELAEHKRNLFEEEPKLDDTWDYHEELRRRSPDTPYVIHIDERQEMVDYQSTTLTYYAGDDVLCNESDEVMDIDGRDQVVGEDNLDKFGHGSNDPRVVYVRNDELEIVFEIVKHDTAYAEEVHGFSHEDYYHGNLERMRVRERDEQEE
jgi:hypothetical protein